LRYSQLAVLTVFLAGCANGSGQQEAKQRKPMNTNIPIYQFIHDGFSVSGARIAHMEIKPGPDAGIQSIILHIETIETLWGNPDPKPSYSFERPESNLGRLKSPDPVWGRVNVRDGALIVLIAKPGQNPIYADEIHDLNDTGFRQLRDLLHVEREAHTAQQTTDRYSGWLAHGNQLEKLYAGEALARNGEIQTSSAIIEAYAHAFASEQDVYTKMSLGTWMWDYIFERASARDRVRIVNVTIEALQSTAPSIRDLALDRISEIDPAVLQEPTLRPSAEAVRLLEERKQEETDPGVRHHLEEIMAALRRAH
jgi:hypothetical protein